MNVLLAGFATLVLAGCGGEPPAQEAPAADTTLVVSSDPELRRVVAELLPDLAERSGLELREPVRVERRSREELESYLVAELDEELEPEEADRTVRSYALLGLVPADLDLRGLLLDVYTEQVAGFYDPDSTALFVLDDMPAETLGPLLVHELVHALQDQAADLDALTAPERGNDRQTAAQAAIEGHATLVMLEYMMEQLQGRAVDLSEVPDFAAQLRPALESVRTQYPALGRAPRVVQEAMLFPYLEGAGFVQALWRARDGRPAPFGPYLPQSTEQVADPERLVGEEPDPPTDVELTVEGRPGVFDATLGQLETRIFLEELSGAAAGDAATGWDGDTLVLVEAPGGDALAWATVWDDPGARDRFVAAVEGGLVGLPASGSVEALEVSGRPVAVLRVGEVDGVTVTLPAGD
ncbi:MAG TPA: hypothetical protein VLL48_10075 [Longimicrobiales bacterium]|nr:hypothetical protein [Longimicrobiales bacterium]